MFDRFRACSRRVGACVRVVFGSSSGRRPKAAGKHNRKGADDEAACGEDFLDIPAGRGVARITAGRGWLGRGPLAWHGPSCGNGQPTQEMLGLG